jgi:ABC-type polysaccharide/polyol phosphate export permease
VGVSALQAVPRKARKARGEAHKSCSGATPETAQRLKQLQRRESIVKTRFIKRSIQYSLSLAVILSALYAFGLLISWAVSLSNPFVGLFVGLLPFVVLYAAAVTKSEDSTK